MNVLLREVAEEEKEILRNLLEKYLFEFSQWDDAPLNALGLFGYRYLDCYWTEENRFPFFIFVEGELAGFALVNDYLEVPEQTDYTMSEFFVLHRYRKKGVASEAAKQLFARFPGRWQLKYHPHNFVSARFWNRVVGETDPQYRRLEAYPNVDYPDGTAGTVLLFVTCS